MFLITIGSVQVKSQANEFLTVQPSQNEIGADVKTSIKIKLKTSLNPDSISSVSFNVFGRISGQHKGKLVYGKESNTLEFIPDKKFAAGEVVLVLAPPLPLATGIKTGSFQWRFTTGVTKKTNPVFNTVKKTGINYKYLKIFDVDHNGIPDLIASDGYSLANNGKGNFSLSAYTPWLANSYIVPDINGDGYEDIVQNNEYSLTIFLSRNDGTFAGKETINKALLKKNGYGDFNSDGFVDLVSWYNDTLHILWNNGAGHFEKDSLSYCTESWVGGIEPADVDNDGNLDIVALEDIMADIYVFYNNGKGEFSRYGRFKTARRGFLEQLHLADFNNDGFIDAAMLGMTNGGIKLYNDQKGGYFFSDDYKNSFGQHERTGYFSVGDMNGDNKLDIVITDIRMNLPIIDTVWAALVLNRDSLYWDENQFTIGKEMDPFLYDIGLGDLNGDGALDILHSGFPALISFSDTATTGVEENIQPNKFYLSQNYPNPFNPVTVISFQLPSSGSVTLKVYDVLGKEIASLVDGYKTAGRYSVTFDASRFTSGIYFYKITSGVWTETRKMILLK